MASYDVGKTIKKGALPFVLFLLVRAGIAAAQAAGITVDETQILTIAAGGYGAIVAFINWLKNRKKTS